MSTFHSTIMGVASTYGHEFAGFFEEVLEEVRELKRLKVSGYSQLLRRLESQTDFQAKEEALQCFENYQSVTDTVDLLRDLFGTDYEYTERADGKAKWEGGMP
jgi:hypothetical protein